MNKKGFQFSWLFSLIIGALILFLALFASKSFMNVSNVQTQATLVRELDILLNPFSSIGSVASMTLSKELTLPVDSQIELSCDSYNNFNALNLRNKRGKKWGNWLPKPLKIKDKYLFGEFLEGKSFWIFGKSFEMPWRVDDLIYITDQSYCFDNPPRDIKEEIKSLDNKVISLKEDGCKPGSINVCFGIKSCEINVNYPLGKIKKRGKEISFSGDALMYAGIFSDLGVYKCNQERLIKRLSKQINLNLEKSKILGDRGCDTNALQDSLTELQNSISLKGINPQLLEKAKEVERLNPKECPIFD